MAYGFHLLLKLGLDGKERDGKDTVLSEAVKIIQGEGQQLADSAF